MLHRRCLLPGEAGGNAVEILREFPHRRHTNAWKRCRVPKRAQGFRYIVDKNFSLKIHSDNFHVELLCFTRLLNTSLGFLIDSASKEAEGIDLLRLGQ